MSTPNRLKIEDGRIKMKDGSSLRKYLLEWQKGNGMENGADINISNHDGLKQLTEDAQLMGAWGC